MYRSIFYVSVVLIIAGIAVPPFFFSPGTITVLEIRYYVIVFLLVVMVGVFGVLRMYNATVQNTRFLHKLNQDLVKYTRELKTLAKAVEDGLRKPLFQMIVAIKKFTSDLTKDRKQE